MIKSTAQFAQANVLNSDSPAVQWTKNPVEFDRFWKWGGNWPGIQSRAKEQHCIDLARRSAVAEVLRRQYDAAGMPQHPAIEAFENGAHVVTAGHQLQVAGGPAYFHYKILSAIRWAQRLRDEGQQAVAVFWLASEDHDFDEIKSAQGLEDQQLLWEPSRAEYSGPVGNLTWDAEAEEKWKAWALGQGFDGADSRSLPTSLADRVRAWVCEWFAGLDLLVIDANDAELKSMAMHLWAAEWEGKGIGEQVFVMAESFRKSFGEPQIQPRLNNLFVLDDAGRRERADRWQQDNPNEDWSKLRPDQHSPNVALRPLYQEYLLQSTAFVGGAAEVSYWMLLSGAFAHHGIHPPALLLRDGALILNATAADVAKDLGWNPNMKGMRGEEAVNAWADRSMQSNGDLQGDFDRWSAALENHAKGIHELTLPTTRAALSKMEKDLAALKKKWRKIIKQQEHTKCLEIAHQFDRWISPHGQPQERVINALALVNAIGTWGEFRESWFEVLQEADEPQFLLFEGVE